MGMFLAHQLTASYAAGSLGGTLGRLNESLRRLSRAQSTGSREKPGVVSTPSSLGVTNLASLHQSLRSMADAWQADKTASPWFGRLDDLLSDLKGNALNGLLGQSEKARRSGLWPEYQRLAQALDILRASGSYY